MEGNNKNNQINDIKQIIEEVNDPTLPLPEPEQVKASSTSHLKIGEIYKITGGKYKKFKTCILEKINDTYSDVKVKETDALLPNQAGTKVVKVKNIYLLRLDPPGWDMPDADQLNVVEDLDKYLKDNPDEKFIGKPEINELGEVVDNITDVLPTIDEALALKKENEELKITISQQECINGLLKAEVDNDGAIHITDTRECSGTTWTSAQVKEITEFVAHAIKLSKN